MKKFRYFYMNTAEILDKVFEIYKKSFPYQILRMLLFGVAGMILYFILIIILSVAIGFSFSEMSGSNSGSPYFALFIVLGIILGLIALFVFSVNTAASLSINRQVFYGRRPKFVLTVKDAWKSSLRVCSVNFLYVIAYLPMVTAVIFFLYILGTFDAFMGYPFFYRNTSGISNNIPLVVFLTILLVILEAAYFVFVQIIGSCALCGAVFEKRVFHTAIKRSLELTKGNRLKIAGAFITWYAVSSVVSYSFTAALSLTSLISSFSNSAAVVAFAATVVQYIASIIVSLLMSPFSDILSSLVYFNQRIKKHGLDIVLELYSIENARLPSAKG
ncbi:MAG: hypothetical protein LBS21_07870 [Clostridiales bacterium]|jgi:hypothetical protein|nr:hypothetical protein [Clostridiales bacterium]